MAKQGSNGDFTLDKALPSSIEAERLILGVVLLDNMAINQAVENLKPDDFFIGSNRRIYEKMIALYERGLAIDPLTLQEELRRAGELEQVGGPAYIAALFDGVPRFSNIENYVKIVKGKSTLRRLITAANQIMAIAFDDEEEPEVILDRAESLIFAIGEDRIKQGFVHVGDVATRQLTVIEEAAGREQLITGLATGFADLDYMTSGLQRGDLIIIAARPSMGKCLTADSEIVLADGSVATIEEIYQRREATLLTLGDDFKFRLARPSAFVDDGIKPVYRVTTRLGRRVDSTLSHPFLTIDGWRKLAELNVSDHVAVPRRIDVFGSEELHEGQVKLLAYLIGDGNLTNANPSFTNTNPRLQQDFAQSLSAFSGLKIRARIDGNRAPTFYVASDFDQIKTEREAFASRLRDHLHDRGAARSLAKKLYVSPSLVHFWLRGACAPRQELFELLCRCLDIAPQELAPNGLAVMSRASRNQLTLWLEEVGLWGRGSREKFIPAIVFQLTKPQLALFLNRLFSTDGWVALNEGQSPQLGYSTVSEKLARQIQSLLLRFGVITKLRKREIKYADTRRESWQLDITQGDSIRAFADQIGVFGKEDQLIEAVRRLSAEETRNNRDLIPEGIWKDIGQAKSGASWASLARRAGLKGHTNIHVGKRALSRRRLAAIAEVLNDDRLTALAHSEVYWDEIVSIEYLGDKQVYDLTIPETHNFVANDICVHNTAFSLNIAQNAAMRPQHNGEKAVIGVFSLEMSNEQLVNRLLCSQARVDAHRLRSGFLGKDEWRRLAVAVGELAETKIYLDDTPGISVLEMRAKARRLKNEQKSLDLLIVDYLQLMSGRGRQESRQQEVSQISRELKMLAKELNVPLVALSQLSRAPETRTGSHKPQLSDLRESGCLAGESLVTMADSGAQIPIRDLAGKSGFKVWALNEANFRLEPTVVSRAFATGVKPVFRLTTRLGRTIRATANHKFRAFAGWKRLDELEIGERLAVPRVIKSPTRQSMSDDELALLGHLIGDGCTLPRHVTQYTTKEKDLAEMVAELALKVFGNEVRPRINQERNWYQVYLASTRRHTHNVHSAISEWLRDLGIWGLRSYEKRIPAKVFEQSREAISVFIRHLWATDGCILQNSKGHPYPAVYYASSSERLARDLHSLLLRFEINSRLHRISQAKKGRDQYHVVISGKNELERFVDFIGAIGQYKSEQLNAIRQFLATTSANTNRDIIPIAIWREYVKPAMLANGITCRQMFAGINTAYCGTRIYRQNVSRERASRIANVVLSPELARLAQSDVYWDEIIAIEADGVEEVFDLTVERNHNFVANDIILHNSIEQDSDVVMFIYREEIYKPETEKQNIAEIIVGKQRNGPTGSVELVFLKQLTRFEDKYKEQA